MILAVWRDLPPSQVSGDRTFMMFFLSLSIRQSNNRQRVYQCWPSVALRHKMLLVSVILNLISQGLSHSSRSAVSGSTRVACPAGIQIAINATAQRISGVRMKAIGSQA
jgi:hypothetical protein